jgi:hypothetical protein
MRKAGIALSAFALAVTLGACGDNGSGGEATNTGAQDTSANAPAAAANLADLAKSIGDETSDATSAHMTITAKAAGQDINGEGDVQFGSADAAMTMDMSTPEGSISMVFVDGILYMKLPQELEPGKPWIKIDPNSNSEMAKALGSLNEELGKNADPRAALQEFEKSGEITSTKEEELDGKKVTHYTITVDVQKMADQQEDPTQKKALQDAIAAGMKDFPVNVYVDEEGLPVRFAMETPTPDGAGGMTSVNMQVDYTDWGKPVEIAAPPADQTTEPPA